ncbi:recombinase family protein [Gymnodinialimonas ceratoperidinii]|uniref:Recombinase family protein n=1 Tax=Gymnodinialimonas ceratoperidinii TaxID=2856823 RepID=A0A8F6TZY3_9RHOB|nr:recombinase family protein [Gymnodinialimonas ceratoperidinii]
MSTQKQGEGVSLEAQKDAIRAFASQHNLTVTQWFEEKETAAKSGRPVFNQMLKQLKQGKAEGLVMHKIDRSARNLRDWALISELPKYGVKPYFAADGMDFETRGGRLSANLQAVIAEDYIFNLREETIKGMNGRLKQGLFPWAAPPGYLDQGGGKPKVPCPKTAPLIKLAFELYATRQYSYATLLNELHRQGLRNRRGGKLTLCGLGNILQNPFYIGIIFVRSTGQTYDGIHEPIVSAAMWQRVQDVRQERSGPKTTRHNHLFQGLFRCGECGKPMVPEIQKGQTYYRCHRRGCTTTSVREDVISQQIRRGLTRLQLNAKAQTRAEREDDQVTIVSLQEQRTALDLQIGDTEQRLSRLEDLLIDGVIDSAAFARKKNEQQVHLVELRDRLARIPYPEAARVYQAKLVELRKNLVLLYEIANRAEKRILIENVWSNRTVQQKNLKLEPYSWVRKGGNDPALLGGVPERDRDRTLLELFENLCAMTFEAHEGRGTPSVCLAHDVE